MKRRGWFNQPYRHSLASKGVQTSRGRTDKLESISEYEESWFNWIDEDDIQMWKSWPEETRRYFVPTTGLPWYIDLRRKPKYHREKKGIDFDVVLMSPDRYREIVVEGFDKPEYKSWSISEQNLNKLKRKVLDNKERFPMLTLKYTRGCFNQEGRHRAELMDRMDVNKVPVVVAWDTDEPPIKEVGIHD